MGVYCSAPWLLPRDVILLTHAGRAKVTPPPHTGSASSPCHWHACAHHTHTHTQRDQQTKLVRHQLRVTYIVIVPHEYTLHASAHLQVEESVVVWVPVPSPPRGCSHSESFEGGEHTCASGRAHTHTHTLTLLLLQDEYCVHRPRTRTLALRHQNTHKHAPARTG